MASTEHRDNQRLTIRLHWADKPYKWHINDGQEVFVVLDGTVDMHVKGPDGTVTITPGMIAHATEGVEHVAHPVVPSRILVIEREGSV